MEKIENEIASLHNEIAMLRKDIQTLTGFVQFLTECQLAKVNLSLDTTRTMDQLIEDDKECPLSTRAINVLYRANIFCIRDLTYLTLKNFKRLRNCGKATLDEIFAYMHSQGITDIPESADDILPNHYVGEPVVMLTRDRCYHYCDSGTIVTITHVHKCMHNYSFELPGYTVQDHAGHEFIVSPGQIQKINM